MSRSKRKPSAKGGTRRLSQHFITSRSLLTRITRIGRIGKNDLVIEIGTGKGHLTQALARRADVVRSIDIDRKVLEQAKRRLADTDNVELEEADILTYHLPKQGDYKVFANIPFHLTTKIVDRLTGAPNPATDIWLIMEKGAALKLIGKPEENDRSLRMKVEWDLSIRYYFQRRDFHPPPSVDCVLLHFKKKATPDIAKSEIDAFSRFVKHARQRGLFGSQKLLTKKQISVALKRADLPPIPTDGQILYVQWLALFRCYREIRR
ncbi:MAG TPA: methyltransferase domain-containing protein [Fastidiosipila sp.]|jgi:23S rRNA (adenine-N6)-dimethyltransferase|nr:methyltransferase domain-containing protein [Fastidiosipila sp.]